MKEEEDEIVLEPGYPKWIYHESLKSKIIQSSSEFGKDWSETPLVKVSPIENKDSEIKELKAELKTGLDKNAKLYKENQELKAEIAGLKGEISIIKTDKPVNAVNIKPKKKKASKKKSA